LTLSPKPIALKLNWYTKLFCNLFLYITMQTDIKKEVKKCSIKTKSLINSIAIKNKILIKFRTQVGSRFI
jgi:hypothetical protein